jgi:hypothetical protein
MSFLTHLRKWAAAEPVYFHQIVAILTGLVSFGVNKLIGADTADATQISGAIYALLSVFGVVVARNKVDGPETVAAKAAAQQAENTNHDRVVVGLVKQYDANLNVYGSTMSELDRAKSLLLKAVLDPGDRQELRKEINTFLGRQ